MCEIIVVSWRHFFAVIHYFTSKPNCKLNLFLAQYDLQTDLKRDIPKSMAIESRLKVIH